MAERFSEGDRVGEYVLEEKLGSGGFGEVWQARHYKWQNQRYALKIPLDDEYVRQLQEESDLAHRIESSHVARMVECCTRERPPHLVMELIKGRTLREILRDKNRLPQKQAVSIVLQAAAGVRAAHKIGVSHRDIKPENIMVTDQGLVKITDFGLGKLREKATTSLSLAGSLMTATGAEVSGTLVYMSPEQLDPDLPVDERTDIYSLGIVLFELLTGKRPQGVEVPSDIAQDMDRRLDAVYKKCCSRIENRYQTVEEFENALREARRGGTRKIERDLEIEAEEGGALEIAEELFQLASEKLFFRRAVAFLVDFGIILFLPLITSLAFPATVELSSRAALLRGNTNVVGVVEHYFPTFRFLFFLFVLAFLYFFIFTLLYEGRTPGKRIFGLRVFAGRGVDFDAKFAALRTTSYLADLATLGLGFLGALVREDGKTFHDILSGSMVIYEGKE